MRESPLGSTHSVEKKRPQRLQMRVDNIPDVTYLLQDSFPGLGRAAWKPRSPKRPLQWQMT